MHMSNIRSYSFLSPAETGRVSGTSKVTNKSSQLEREDQVGREGGRKERKEGRQYVATEFFTQGLKLMFQQKLTDEFSRWMQSPWPRESLEK